MTPEQLRQLGLPADATDAQITAKLAEVASLRSELDSVTSTLEDVTATAEASSSALRQLRAQQQDDAAKRKEAEIARFKNDAVSRGLWEPGSDRERHFDKLAKVDVALAGDYVALLTPQNPLGQGSQVATLANIGDVGSMVPQAFGSILSTDYSHVQSELHSVYTNAFDQLGVTEEMLRDFGPAAIEKKQKRHRDDWSAAMRGKVA